MEETKNFVVVSLDFGSHVEVEAIDEADAMKKAKRYGGDTAFGNPDRLQCMPVVKAKKE